MNKMNLKEVFLIVCSFICLIKLSNGHKYGKGFFNHTGCLYTYLEGGNFEMMTADGDVISERLDVKELTFDSAKSRCIQHQQGRVVFSFAVDENSKLKSIAISMKIVESSSEGYWEIKQANLTITRADIERRRTFPLDVKDMYAGQYHSYSCNELVLQTLHKRKQDNDDDRIEPKAIITLDRFQLQPFAELDRSVFAPSFNCAVWTTLPLVMGLFTVLFIIMITLIGVEFLRNIESNDFKFSKEGLLFTQSQMESNKIRN